MIPGEYFLDKNDILLNDNLQVVKLNVKNNDQKKL